MLMSIHSVSVLTASCGLEQGRQSSAAAGMMGLEGVDDLTDICRQIFYQISRGLHNY